jgi:hypothetical protein
LESHEEYSRLCKNSAVAEFSFLQKLRETTQKNTKNLRDNVTELLLWTVHPPSPVGGRPRASTRRCARPPTTRVMRPPSPAGLRPPSPASTCERPCAHAPSVACRSATARAPVQDGAPAHDHAPALSRRLARGCAQKREGRGCQLVCGSRPGSAPGIHYRLVHRLT